LLRNENENTLTMANIKARNFGNRGP